MKKNDLMCIYDVPMKSLEKIAKLRNMTILTCIDANYNVVVYIPQLSRIKNKKYLSNLEGRGLTYRDACVDFIINLMDYNYNIRYKEKYYITSLVRTYVISLGINYIYERNKNE